MAKVAKNPAVDPTLPKVELKLGGQTYFLCFTFAGLALAEAKLRAQGIAANLLHALDLSSLDASTVAPLLFGAMVTHDPKITFDQVSALVTLRNVPAILQAITSAYEQSLAEPTEESKSVPLDETPE